MIKQTVVVAAFLVGSLFSHPALAPNLDFEAGLRGWSPSGSAFDGQPIAAESLRTTDETLPVALGGDYWRALPYPLGASGTRLIHSSDEGRGTLTSDEIVLEPDQRFFSVLVGGANDSTRERVELQVRSHAASGATLTNGNSDYVVLKTFTGSGAERLRRESFEIPADWRGQPVRVRIADDSAGPGGHINVDDVQFTNAPASAQRAALWGIADSHTHVMTHMGFGGLNGIRTVWGVPGGAYADYVANPHLVSRDLPECTQGHGGGPSAEIVINTAEGRFATTGSIGDLVGLLRSQYHRRHGGPGFYDFPSFRSGLHEQMHITQIHRAWEGGLRLMVAIAVHNTGVEYLMSKPAEGGIVPSSERQVLDAQICGIRALAKLNKDWMEIAYSPSDARRIIERNKLAIVVGIEMDEMGRLDSLTSCGAAHPCPFETFDKEVKYLWNLGIRQVTPIHAVDNRLGSAAVFQPVYNSLNDLLNRGKVNLNSDELQYWPPRFFEVREGGCDKGPFASQFGECVTYRLDQKQQRPAMMHELKTLFRTAPFVVDDEVPTYYGFGGMMNAHGLTPEGRDYVKLLMKSGMIVGLEHMSQQSVDDVHHVIAGLLSEQGHADCVGFGAKHVPAPCYEAAYPLSFSHASMRALSIYSRDATTVEGFRPSEYEVSDREARLIGRTGGFVGQFAAEAPVIPPAGFAMPPGLENDCGGSSKSFALSYAYMLARIGGGVALATDFTIIAGTSPRFGKYACWAYHSAVHPEDELARLPSQYAFAKQRDGVVYVSYAKRVPHGVTPGHNAPLTAYEMDGRRPFDINVDGFAHYGLLPDMLQDAKNVGMPREDFESLFSSAEAYVRTWEKIGRVMGVTFPDNFNAIALPCQVACRGLCPNSPRAGAPPPPRD